MQKKVFLVHGWDGHPGNCWFPWLKNQLEAHGFLVFIPTMPHPDEPTIHDWVKTLAATVSTPDQNCFFVGHSVGCPTILRYFEQINTKVGGLVCVAGWFNLPYLATQKEKDIAAPWLNTPMDFNKINAIAPHITAIFSDNDPDVPLEDQNIFKEKLKAKIIIEHNKGHFSDDAEVKELPVVLNEILEISTKT